MPSVDRLNPACLGKACWGAAVSFVIELAELEMPIAEILWVVKSNSGRTREFDARI